MILSGWLDIKVSVHTLVISFTFLIFTLLGDDSTADRNTELAQMHCPLPK